MLFIKALPLFWTFCPIAVIAGAVNTTPSNLDAGKTARKNSLSSDRKSKRLVDAQTATLLQTGVLLAHYPLLEYGDPNFQDYSQFNHHVGVHQEETPLVASRHPTKPVYHYTPLPPGTFPAKTIPDEEKSEDVNDKSGNEYSYNYLVRNGGHDLDLGQREVRQGDLVRGIYHVLLPDHRTQVVKYWSDWSGYHPTISYSYE